MGERFLRNALLYSGFLLGLSLTLRAQECPDKATFEVTDEQTPGGNDGSITVTFSGLYGDMDPAADNFQYSLFNKEIGGYLYDAALLGPDFYENSRITLNFRPPGTLTFQNLPPQSGYIVVLTSPSCQKLYNSTAEGITVKASEQ
jgi:hypothetical protein